ncbi:MAG: hypothetical protein LC754_08040 [Acidobacteria bacterium]|nr:hypothetical protein [Acidobacteriota bacterium]
MRDGCAACGACPVGPPLARPERELPSYGRAFLIVATGVLLVFTFAVATVAALFERESLAFDARALLRAAEAAAWRLKWLALPFSMLAAWVCARACAGMRREPARFVGLRAARAGFALTLLVAVSLSTLIAVTIPERLRQRELSRRAAENALLYAGDQALHKYRLRFGTYPASLSDLRKLDDPDCSIALAVAAMDAGKYAPETDLASLSTGRSKGRGARRTSAVRVRNASALSTDDLSGAGLSLTNYELVLPGRDRILGTPDDLTIRDGVIFETPRHVSPPSNLASNRNSKER